MDHYRVAGPPTQTRWHPIHELVDELRDVSAALAAVAAPVVGVDVERTTKPRYRKPAALVQIGTPERAVLVDTHALGPVPEVGAFLSTRSVVMHAATNDIESMDAAAMVLDDLDDTSIAAGLLGMPLGLDTLLDQELGVDLGPGKSRFQRADWEQRPLPDDMAAYAAADVMHLPALMDGLRARLEEAGRLEWYRQECAHMLERVRMATRSWKDLSGVGRLSDGQRAIARALWERREVIASRDDIAPSWLLRDKVLLDLASNPPSSARDIRRRNQRRTPGAAAAAELFDAVQRGTQAEPEPRPERPDDGLDHDVARDRHAALRTARSRVASELDMDPGLLAPSRTLWQPVHAQPTSPEELASNLDLRPWAVEVLRDPLWDALQAVSS